MKAMFWVWLALLLLWADSRTGLYAQVNPPLRDEAITLTVNGEKVIRSGADRFLGINLNYIRDSDANRPGARPLAAALGDMRAKWLRFPGGEKSDFHRWSLPPYDKPQPQSLGWYNTQMGERMDFDQYIEIVRKTGAEPYVVVGYDNLKRTGIAKDEWIKSAAAWVRYSNVTRKYGVRYWEIGNENWHNSTAKPEEMAQIVKEFSQAMKAEDPTIQVGSSGHHWWWGRFLPAAAPYLDFVTISLYNCDGWGTYEYFPRNLRSDTISPVQQALKAIREHAPAPARDRIKLIVAETNAFDFSKKWPDRNNLGHALVIFDTFGRLLQVPRVEAAMLWNTRWMKDEEAAKNVMYALDGKNDLLPAAMALRMWGEFILPEMVEITGQKDAVAAYACRTPDQRRLTIWILNASSSSSMPVRLNLDTSARLLDVTAHRFEGKSADDESPLLKEIEPPALRHRTIDRIVCPPLSITVLQLK